MGKKKRKDKIIRNLVIFFSITSIVLILTLLYIHKKSKDKKNEKFNRLVFYSQKYFSQNKDDEGNKEQDDKNSLTDKVDTKKENKNLDKIKKDNKRKYASFNTKRSYGFSSDRKSPNSYKEKENRLSKGPDLKSNSRINSKRGKSLPTNNKRKIDLSKLRLPSRNATNDKNPRTYTRSYVPRAYPSSGSSNTGSGGRKKDNPLVISSADQNNPNSADNTEGAPREIVRNDSSSSGGIPSNLNSDYTSSEEASQKTEEDNEQKNSKKRLLDADTEDGIQIGVLVDKHEGKPHFEIVSLYKNKATAEDVLGKVSFEKNIKCGTSNTEDGDSFYGCFVKSIMGVPYTEEKSWFFFTSKLTSLSGNVSWNNAKEGIHAVELNDGDILGLSFTAWDSNWNPEKKPSTAF